MAYEIGIYFYIIVMRLIILAILTIAALIVVALKTSLPAVLLFGAFTKGVLGI